MSWPLVAGAGGIGCMSLLLLGGHGPAVPAEIVPGGILSQPFGCSSFELEPVEPTCPGGHIHYGIDLAAPEGTAVLAPEAGIASAGIGPSCGVQVVIDHGAGVQTVYCHLSQAAVRSGSWVAAGERIGSIGATGMATGPHLHFEVHAAGRPLDPAAWLRSLPAYNHSSGGK